MTIVALLQLDHTVGDIDANVKSIENAVGIAQENGADLAVSSELAISGYPPRDLLEKHGFVRQCIEATKSIQGFKYYHVLPHAPWASHRSCSHEALSACS